MDRYWISIAEEPPKPVHDILVWRSNFVEVVRVGSMKWHAYFGCGESEYLRRELGVSHWMPAPDEPKEGIR